MNAPGPVALRPAVLALALTLALSACGRRQEADAPPVAAAASASASETASATATAPVPALAAQGAGSVPACSSCHGAAGEGQAQAGFPRIAGQSYAYLAAQLDSYVAGTRRHATMGPIATALSAEQRLQLAAHYASLPPAGGAATAPTPPASAMPPLNGLKTAHPVARSAGALAAGQRLASQGDAASGVQGCANCHGVEGVGQGSAYPYLAGQHRAYLLSALAAWRDGSRRNDPSGQMILIAKSLQDRDLQAVAEHYAGLAPPPQPRDADLSSALPSRTGTLPAVVSGPRGAGTASAGAASGAGIEQGAATSGGAQGPGGGGAGTSPAPSPTPSLSAAPALRPASSPPAGP